MKRVTRWTLALGLAAGIGIGAPSAAWAKDPEPGATPKEKMVKDAPDAAPRRKKGRGEPAGGVKCEPKEQKFLRCEWRVDGECYSVYTCYRQTTPRGTRRSPCKYIEWECSRLEEDLCCGPKDDGPKDDDDKFMGDGWIDEHGIE